MFFPFCAPCHRTSRSDHQQHKLNFLKMMRDSLETRLAAINAAIETVERQASQSTYSEPNES
ncbi:MAG: hypothetical protein AAFO06_08690 [Cyanobacteria bacterium J06597_16]